MRLRRRVPLPPPELDAEAKRASVRIAKERKLESSAASTISSSPKSASPTADRPSSCTLDDQPHHAGQSLAQDKAGSDDDEGNVLEVRRGCRVCLSGRAARDVKRNESTDEAGDGEGGSVDESDGEGDAARRLKTSAAGHERERARAKRTPKE